MNKPLMSALTGLKRKEPDIDLKDCVCEENSEAIGYNECLDELEKYELCEQDLANLILEKYGELLFIGPDTSLILSEYLISNAHLWIKRKDS